MTSVLTAESRSVGKPLLVSPTIDDLEVAFLVLFGAFVATSWVSFTLAELGVDRPLVVLGIGCLAFLIALAVAFRHDWQLVGIRDLVGLAVPVVLGAILFFPPDEWIFGALDPGAYVNTGAIIARTGAILAPDPFLASLPPSVRAGLFPFPASRLPGIYLATIRFSGIVPNGFTDATDHIVPHGFHFYPTVLAFGYALGGIWPELYVTPILAVAGLIASFLLWRRLFGLTTAAIASSLLALCSAEVWFARYPDAEILAQLLLFGGLFAFVLTIDSPSKWTAMIAGFALGAVHLTKIEALSLPIVIALFLGYEVITGQFTRARFWFVVPYVALLCQAVVHALTFSGWYTASSFGGTFTRRELIAIAVAALAGTVGSCSILLVPWLRNRARAIFTSSTLQTVVGKALPYAVLLLACYAYYLRPRSVASVSAAPTQLLAINDAESFVRLGWYIGPIGLLLGALGWALLARNERARRSGLPLLVLAVDTLAYLDHTHITPVHYWAARRWVTDIIPGMVAAAAYLLVRLLPALGRPRFDRIIPVAFGIVMVLGLYDGTRPLLGYVEYRGAISQMSALAAVVPPDGIVLFPDGDSGERFSTPIEYLFGRQSVVVWQTPDAYAAARQGAQTWLAEGRPVYWVGTPNLPGPDKAGLRGEIVARQHVAVVEKIAAINTRPGADGLFQQDLQIWRIDGLAQLGAPV